MDATSSSRGIATVFAAAVVAFAMVACGAPADNADTQGTIVSEESDLTAARAEVLNVIRPEVEAYKKGPVTFQVLGMAKYEDWALATTRVFERNNFTNIHGELLYALVRREGNAWKFVQYQLGIWGDGRYILERNKAPRELLEFDASLRAKYDDRQYKANDEDEVAIVRAMEPSVSEAIGREALSNALTGQDTATFQQLYIRRKGEWAYFWAKPMKSTGAEINYKGTPFQSRVESGDFHNHVQAVLRNVDSAGWTVVDFEIGSTSPTYGNDYVKNYKVPTEILPPIAAVTE